LKPAAAQNAPREALAMNGHQNTERETLEAKPGLEQRKTIMENELSLAKCDSKLSPI
jgi:hypothetical protein